MKKSAKLRVRLLKVSNASIRIEIDSSRAKRAFWRSTAGTTAEATIRECLVDAGLRKQATGIIKKLMAAFDGKAACTAIESV